MNQNLFQVVKEGNIEIIKNKLLEDKNIINIQNEVLFLIFLKKNL